jgi:hypothetical protein
MPLLTDVTNAAKPLYISKQWIAANCQHDVPRERWQRVQKSLAEVADSAVVRVNPGYAAQTSVRNMLAQPQVRAGALYGDYFQSMGDNLDAGKVYRLVDALYLLDPATAGNLFIPRDYQYEGPDKELQTLAGKFVTEHVAATFTGATKNVEDRKQRCLLNGAQPPRRQSYVARDASLKQFATEIDGKQDLFAQMIKDLKQKEARIVSKGKAVEGILLVSDATLNVWEYEYDAPNQRYVPPANTVQRRIVFALQEAAVGPKRKHICYHLDACIAPGELPPSCWNSKKKVAEINRGRGGMAQLTYYVQFTRP